MSLLNLLLIFFYYTVLTFGNGPVIIPLLQKDLVENAQIITTEQLLYAFTIGQVTPGQANLYIAAVGFMVFGVVGAILSAMVIVLPGFLIIPLLHYFEKLKGVKVVNHFIKGITYVSVGLILAAALQIAQSFLTGSVPWIVFLATIIMIRILRLNLFISLATASILGIFLHLKF